jgi:hypothetical protein
MSSTGESAPAMKRLMADAFPSRRSWTISRTRGSLSATAVTISQVRSSQPLATTISSASSPQLSGWPRIAPMASAMFASSL